MLQKNINIINQTKDKIPTKEKEKKNINSIAYKSLSDMKLDIVFSKEQIKTFENELSKRYKIQNISKITKKYQNDIKEIDNNIRK